MEYRGSTILKPRQDHWCANLLAYLFNVIGSRQAYDDVMDSVNNNKGKIICRGGWAVGKGKGEVGARGGMGTERGGLA